MTIDQCMALIRMSLNPDLLKPAFRKLWTPNNPTYGFCYIATEALYHMHGKMTGWVPTRAKDESGITHWWLQRYDVIADPTADQYYNAGKQPPWLIGKGGGFLTREPSARTRALMSKLSHYREMFRDDSEEYGPHTLNLRFTRLVWLMAGSLTRYEDRDVVGPGRMVLKHDVLLWLDENIPDAFQENGMISFTSEADLLMFKMRWNDEA